MNHCYRRWSPGQTWREICKLLGKGSYAWGYVFFTYLSLLLQINEQIVGRFHDIQDMVKARGEGIDSILDATEGKESEKPMFRQSDLLMVT